MRRAAKPKAETVDGTWQRSHSGSGIDGLPLEIPSYLPIFGIYIGTMGSIVDRYDLRLNYPPTGIESRARGATHNKRLVTTVYTH